METIDDARLRFFVLAYALNRTYERLKQAILIFEHSIMSYVEPYLWEIETDHSNPSGDWFLVEPYLWEIETYL